jgi:hypothetical protein
LWGEADLVLKENEPTLMAVDSRGAASDGFYHGLMIGARRLWIAIGLWQTNSRGEETK